MFKYFLLKAANFPNSLQAKHTQRSVEHICRLDGFMCNAPSFACRYYKRSQNGSSWSSQPLSSPTLSATRTNPQCGGQTVPLNVAIPTEAAAFKQFPLTPPSLSPFPGWLGKQNPVISETTTGLYIRLLHHLIKWHFDTSTF